MLVEGPLIAVRGLKTPSDLLTDSRTTMSNFVFPKLPIRLRRPRPLLTSVVYKIEYRVGLSLPTLPLAWVQARGTLSTGPQPCICITCHFSSGFLPKGQLCQQGHSVGLVQLLETAVLSLASLKCVERSSCREL